MTDDMNFWIEINATPVSTVNSADLLVYLVKKGKNISFFNSDWRESADVELVGAINRNEDFHHEHSANSAHHLIRLTAGTGGLLGSKNLDISSDFWLILYDTSPNNTRAWNLKYHPSSLCTNTNGWYYANQTRWTTSLQSGCPDVHTHMARRDATYMDGVRATVTAEGVSETKDFYFGVLPNLAPNSTNFTSPLRGTYSGTTSINWNSATDPNEDTITYNLYLLDGDGVLVETLLSNSPATTYSWNTTTQSNANYSIKGTACDSSLCAEFFSEPFSINNSSPIYSIDTITMGSDNTNATIAVAGDVVSLTFSASGTISTPTCSFYSGGVSVNGVATVTNTSGNDWVCSFTVNTNDTAGQITFILSGTGLAAEYTQITSGSYVTINTVSTTAVASGTSNPSAPVCTNQKNPIVPNLFQIDVASNMATLYYSPISSNNSNYYISFSEKSGVFEHGTHTNQSTSNGVLSFSVNHLKPSTVYYFKVRGENGCMPGDWSNEMVVKTKSIGNNSFSKYYKNISLPSYLKNTSKKPQDFFIKSTLIDISAPPTPTPTDKPKQEIKRSTKHCFLFWCW